MHKGLFGSHDSRRVLRSVVIGLCMVTPLCARAIPILGLISGHSTVTILDNSSMDLNPAAGVIAFSGAVGFYTGTFSTGITKPAIGTATQPFLSISSTDLASESGGFLTIFLSDNAFGPVNAPFTMHIDGTNSIDPATVGGGVTFSALIMPPSASAAPIGSQGPFTGTSYSNDFVASGLFPANTLVSTEVILNLAPGTTSQFNATLNFAEPPGSSLPDTGTTVVLLGAGLLFLIAVKACRLA